MANLVVGIILGAIAIGCFIGSYRHFHEKGFLFNNAYLYASKEEREKMDKKPYYRQSAIAFLMIGIIFVINAIGAIFEVDWAFALVMPITTITVIYAVVSSIKIEKRNKK